MVAQPDGYSVKAALYTNTFTTARARITVSGILASDTEAAFGPCMCAILMVGVIYAHAYIFIGFISHIFFLSDWTVIL